MLAGPRLEYPRDRRPSEESSGLTPYHTDMDVWGWIVLYAAGLTLLQLLVYRYLLNNRGSLTRRVGTPSGDGEGDVAWSNRTSDSRETSRPSSSSSAGDGDREDRSIPSSSPPHRSPGRSIPSLEDGGGLIEPEHVGAAGNRRCPHCGAENEDDETFTRCWNCARGL